MISKIALLALFGSSLASTLSDHTTTETIGPQELGTTASAGSIVYSMNLCTVVQTTTCSVSFSTGGPVPTYSAIQTSEYGHPPPVSAESHYSVSVQTSGIITASSVPTSTAATQTSAHETGPETAVPTTGGAASIMAEAGKVFGVAVAMAYLM